MIIKENYNLLSVSFQNLKIFVLNKYLGVMVLFIMHIFLFSQFFYQNKFLAIFFL